jgi:hypothetical protein
MSFSEKMSDRQVPEQISVSGEQKLLAVVAICFLVLHILAATVLIPMRRNDAPASSEPARLSFGD